jgi:hypothetical protein
MLVAAPLAALGVAVKFAPCLDEINRVTLKYIRNHGLSDNIFQSLPYHAYFKGPPRLCHRGMKIELPITYEPTIPPDDDDWEDEL